jgi:arsenate reductase-like glutaredoxin family protein
LRSLGVQLQERDLGKEPLNERELQTLIGTADVAEFLNTRSARYRDRGLKAKPPTKAQAITWMAQDPNLIKRPIIVKGQMAVIGFDEAKIRALATSA